MKIKIINPFTWYDWFVFFGVTLLIYDVLDILYFHSWIFGSISTIDNAIMLILFGLLLRHLQKKGEK